jgi:outer membrane protein OmpA-like peptidoglycan-associated protein
MFRRAVTTSLFVLSSLLSASARAQAGGDDWSTFPHTPDPAAPAPATVTPAPAASVDAGTPEVGRVTPAAATPATAPAAAASTRSSTPAAAVSPAPSAPVTDGGARAFADASLDQADGGVALAEDDAKLISTKERFEAGTEPHSPATLHNALAAKENLRVTTGAAGIGVLDVASATLGPKGLLRFYANGEFLNQKDFPVLNATDVRSTGTFGVSFVPVENVEVFLSYAAMANSNSRSSPTLIQALGDVTLGGKYARRFAKGFDAGLDLKLLSYSGVGNQSISRYAWGAAPRLIATYDLREPLPKVPLRVHGNLGFIFDSTAGMVTQFPLNAAEQFALGVNRFHRMTFGLAVEAPLPAVTLFLEYNAAVPLGAGGKLFQPNGVAATVASAAAQTLGLGFKVTAVKDLTLLVALDFGLARSVGLGVPATPPFDFRFGAAFNIDPFQRGETKFVETLKERKLEVAKAELPKTGKVSGMVVDSATRKPIPGVIVAMVGAGLPPVASDAATGHFLTHELPAGPVKLSAQKDGYKEAGQEVALEAGKVTLIEMALEATAKKATFELTVVSKKKAIASTAVFKGAVEQKAATAEGATAPVNTEVPPGNYIVNVTAPGYLAQTREVQVSDGAKMALNFDLVPEPKKRLVIVKDNKIEVAQQVHFVSGKATILADSFLLLQQVVDAIVTNDIKRVRVEGHTDNKGLKAANQRLSEDRARSVADFLISQGIDKGRIESVGYGDSKPVAPNLTARGRELNRRVDFVIVER